jgi:hypothetical protein
MLFQIALDLGFVGQGAGNGVALPGKNDVHARCVCPGGGKIRHFGVSGTTIHFSRGQGRQEAHVSAAISSKTFQDH